MNKEILAIIESLSNEKSISKDSIFTIIENILEISIKKKYNNNINIDVLFNKELGTFKVFQKWKIVDNVLNNNLEISYKNINLENLNLGDFVKKEIISPIKFNRIITQSAKNIIFQRINEIEKLEIINKFKKFIGKILLCYVKKIKDNKIILNVNDYVEGIIYNKDLLPNDNLKLNSKIKGILYNIKNTKNGIKLLISRSNIKFIEELLKSEISEINDNIIEIKSISRNPGIKSKVALKSNNLNIKNPVKYCIKNKRYRIKNISNELNGEYIDFILWDNNLFKFIINSFYPIKIISISNNKDKNNIDIIVNKNDLSKIIGKNGYNIKLIKFLINKEFNIISNNN